MLLLGKLRGVVAAARAREVAAKGALVDPVSTLFASRSSSHSALLVRQQHVAASAKRSLEEAGVASHLVALDKGIVGNSGEEVVRLHSWDLLRAHLGLGYRVTGCRRVLQEQERQKRLLLGEGRSEAWLACEAAAIYSRMKRGARDINSGVGGYVAFGLNTLPTPPSLRPQATASTPSILDPKNNKHAAGGGGFSTSSEASLLLERTCEREKGDWQALAAAILRIRMSPVEKIPREDLLTLGKTLKAQSLSLSRRVCVAEKEFTELNASYPALCAHVQSRALSLISIAREHFLAVGAVAGASRSALGGGGLGQVESLQVPCKRLQTFLLEAEKNLRDSQVLAEVNEAERSALLGLLPELKRKAAHINLSLDAVLRLLEEGAGGEGGGGERVLSQTGREETASETSLRKRGGGERIRRVAPASPPSIPSIKPSLLKAVGKPPSR